jgi:MFS family permease
VAGYTALQAGLATLPTTLVMFVLSKRAGALADRFGPRLFMGVGPLVAAVGLLLLLRLNADADYLTQLLPALLVFSLGLALTVSPLTATVLADADESDAGIASAVNNAIARTAGLIAVAAVGAVVAANYASELDSRLSERLPPSARPALEQAKRRAFGRIDPRALPPSQRPAAEAASAEASKQAFHLACGIGAALLAVAGLAGLAVRNPRRPGVSAGECPGGQLTGAPRALHPATATAEPAAG